MLPIDVGRFLADNSVKITNRNDDNAYFRYYCTCPNGHGGSDSYAYVDRKTGIHGFSCSHNSCQGVGWRQLLEHYGLDSPSEDYATLETGYDVAPARGAPKDRSPKDLTPPYDWTGESDDVYATLHEQEDPLEFLVDGVVVAGQLMLMGGASKTLKTAIATDLAVSLTSGTDFLGKFPVPEQVPVGMISGESGMRRLRQRIRTIVEYRDIDPDLSEALFLSDHLPNFGSEKDIDGLEIFVKRNGLRCLILDPLYLCGLGSIEVSNVYQVGEKLQGVSDMCARNDCTLILIHHFTKTAARSKGAPRLEDFSQAGVAEIARQWILVTRDDEYKGNGVHSLCLYGGGSEGHSLECKVEIDEGTLSYIDDPITGISKRDYRWTLAVNPLHADTELVPESIPISLAEVRTVEAAVEATEVVRVRVADVMRTTGIDQMKVRQILTMCLDVEQSGGAFFRHLKPDQRVEIMLGGSTPGTRISQRLMRREIGLSDLSLLETAYLFDEVDKDEGGFFIP